MILACLGDSLTYGYGIPRPRVWTTLLAQRTNIDVHNCGINGDTTGGMLARFNIDVVQYGADAVLIMGGFNDLALGAGIGTIKANIFALVQHSFNARVRPVLGVPIPVHPPITFPVMGSVNLPQACAEYANLHEWIRVLARDFSLQCVDFSLAFTAVLSEAAATAHPQANDLSALYTDGLHASEVGHEIMAQQAARVLG
jgi:lysophospholipase L1-like esterase